MRERERAKREIIPHHINSDDFERLTLPLNWSSTSLICPWTNNHHQQRICRERPWSWTKTTIDSSTKLIRNKQQILFHSNVSSSTEVILADRPLPINGKFYWEIFMPAVFGSSIMFGIATKQQTLISSNFQDLIGIDHNGWALSHQGYLLHNGISRQYLNKSIDLLRPVLIGLEFDGNARTLAYYINNEYFGIAFDSIPQTIPIYPAVSSTSAQSTMILQHSCRICSTLHEICLKKLQQQ